MTRPKGWAQLVGLTMIGGLMCATLLAAAAVGWAAANLRLAPVPASQEESGVPREIGAPDARLGWSLLAGANGASTKTGSRVEYRINGRSIRSDVDYPYAKRLGIRRVVLIGDSNAFGFGVPIEQHFSTLLASYFQDVEVINLGVIGYGIDQALLRLRYEGLRYQPDLVIAYVPHYSENRHMNTERFGKKKPMFILRGGELVLINSPVEQGPRIFPNAEAQKSQDERDLQDPEFGPRIASRAEAIFEAMSKTATFAGARFLLVTRYVDVDFPSFNVRAALNNKALELPNGLRHMNEAGNGILAWELAKHIKKRRLLEPPTEGRATTHIVARISGDHYKGPPQFSILFDGKVVVEAVDVSAERQAGEWQELEFAVPTDKQPANVSIRFLNDTAFGGDKARDRNLWVDQIAIDGRWIAASDAIGSEHADRDNRPAILPRNGDLIFRNPVTALRPSS